MLAGGELFERDTELHALAAALDGVHRAGAVVTVGAAPGTGRTALLAAAARMAAEREHVVLSARGSDAGRGVPFAIVRELLARELDRRSPRARALLLRGGAAPAASVFGADTPGSPEVGGPGRADAPGSPTDAAGEADAPGSATGAAIVGLHWLLVHLAERRPLALLVDDAERGDAASIGFLAHAAARIAELPVVLVVAARMPAGGEEDRLGRIEQAARTATRLRPGPLGPAAVARLVGAPVASAFAAACREVTGGNPFLVAELGREIAARGIEPGDASVGAVRALGPAPIAQRALLRATPGAAAVARSLAVLGDGASTTLCARHAGLDPAAMGEAVAALTGEGVVADALPLRFAHPIVRTALAARLAAAERAVLHARAATVLHEAGEPPSRVATHLLETEPGALGPWVVPVLRGVAANARARGAPALASAALRRAVAEPRGTADAGAGAAHEPRGTADAGAAHEPRDPTDELLRELGLAAFEAGEIDAVVHLRAVHARAPDARARARAALDLVPALISTGAVPAAVTALREALAGIRGADDELEAEIAAEVAAIAALDEPSAAAAMPGLEARTGAAVDSPVARRTMANVAQWIAMSGGSAARVTALARRALDGGHLLRDAGPRSPAFLYAVALLVQADAFAEADVHLDRALALAREQGSAIGYVTTSMLRSFSAYRQGALDAAVAEARAATDSAEEHGWELGLPATVGFLVDALIERGDLDEAGEALQRYDADTGMPSGMLGHAYLVSRGRLHLARRETHAAIVDFEELAQRTAGEGWSATIGAPTFRTYLAAALAAAGATDRAAALATEEVELARGWGAPRAVGMALRLQGVLTAGPERIARLERAVAVLAPAGAVLEHARALADLGAALRRDGQPSAAREPLTDALALAERCRATPLARYAQEELAATGARRRRAAGHDGVGALTPSEQRTARLAADGLSNVEIAHALFLTRKTIEMHLTQAYRKLGIASRSELPAALTAAGPDAPPLSGSPARSASPAG